MHTTRLPRGVRRGKALAIAAATAVVAGIVFTGVPAATAATSDPNPAALELKNAALSREAATQGMVLLENHDHALPIAKKGNIALFGVGAYKTVKGGTGSGNVNNRYTISARQGLTDAGYKVTTSDAYWSAMTQAYDTKYPASATGSTFGSTVDYASVEQPLTAANVAPSAATDTAVFVVARNSGEGSDRTSGKGDYQLTDIERANLKLLGQTYKRVVVVLNTGGIVDTSFFQQINSEVKNAPGGQALDALLLMSQAGQESGAALTEVLNGTVTPSGKLTDTWASQYSYYPASATFGKNDNDPLTEQYTEGIYVGYRYFDSLYKKLNPADPSSVVNYEFGYGQSYTDFDIKAQQVKADAKTVKVTAKVTNTGRTYSGKEVVQVYVSAPQTGLDKAYQQLTGYAKTDNLAPGQSQTVTVSFDTTSLAAYDESRAAYVLDAGDYVVRVGNSSRNTHVAARLNLAKSVVTEQDHTELNDQKPATELTSSTADFYTYPGEKSEIARSGRIKLNPSSFRTEKKASPYQQNVSVDSSSPYYALDGDKISSTTVYLDPKQKNWEGTGSAYAPKTGEQVKHVSTNTATTLYDVAKGKATMEQFVAGLSVSQLADIVEGSSAAGTTLTAKGAAGYTTPNYEKLGIPGMALSDGPAGLRLTQQIGTGDAATYQFGTAWPVGTLLAQSWDRGLVAEVGTAVGEEMQEYGVQLWLAPGMNIHRDPLNGRNFEYYSEDPLVSGLTAAATTEGVQSIPGVGVTIKHFAENSQETNRTTSNSVIGERTLREIELKGFEIAVKAAQPMSVMSSYNKINGTWTASNYDLLTDLLRGEWGYKGTVMSDWGGSHGSLTSMYAGNDLIEPGGNPAEVINAIKQVAPTTDVTGLPVYNRTVTTTRTSYTWQFGGFTPSATGGTTLNTTVDAKTDLSKTPLSGETVRDAYNNQVFTANAKYASVDAAYKAVVALLDPSAAGLTAAQKAGISLTNVQHATAGDDSSPVVAYTVAIKGDYPAQGYPLRLGDLQRSAIRVLTTAAQSSAFEELAGLNGVKGIKVGPYTSQFKNLEPAVTATLSKVSRAPSGNSHGSNSHGSNGKGHGKGH